ncbi:hypothetical protein Taro_031328 [Colocasia esculenta]|uniref:Uncharacterized protein n=1 Tax=Colocasia esculenta TaxID=4460 RepID=A0A843VUD8_COLES|nr:hypothetical protein [Colocasia esculenta]
MMHGGPRAPKFGPESPLFNPKGNLKELGSLSGQLRGISSLGYSEYSVPSLISKHPSRRLSILCRFGGLCREVQINSVSHESRSISIKQLQVTKQGKSRSRPLKNPASWRARKEDRDSRVQIRIHDDHGPIPKRYVQIVSSQVVLGGTLYKRGASVVGKGCLTHLSVDLAFSLTFSRKNAGGTVIITKHSEFTVRDYRSNRVALFDGIEEGGIRASSSYSSHEIDEHDNDRALDGLQDRVNILKRGNDMDASRGVLSGTMDRFKMVFETKSSRRMATLVASFVALFLLVYYLTK